MITNSKSGTRVDEIATDIFRISTPIPAVPGGFTFNQFLVRDDQPLLFHTGPRKLFPLVSEALATLLPVTKLRYVGLSHVEADECGSLDLWLAGAPEAQPVCSRIAAMTSIEDLVDRPAMALADGQELELGSHSVRWLDAPHVPHNWECGFLFERRTQTLLCGDLFTQPGADLPPLTESDVLAPSEALRAQMGGVAVTPESRAILEKLARTEPRTLACMHGSSYRGDGAKLLRAFADALGC